MKKEFFERLPLSCRCHTLIEDTQDYQMKKRSAVELFFNLFFSTIFACFLIYSFQLFLSFFEYYFHIFLGWRGWEECVIWHLKYSECPCVVKHTIPNNIWFPVMYFIDVCIIDTINCHSRISCYNMTTFRGRFVVSQNSLRNIHLKRQKDKNRKIQNDKKPKRQKAKRIK